MCETKHKPNESGRERERESGKKEEITAKSVSSSRSNTLQNKICKKNKLKYKNIN